MPKLALDPNNNTWAKDTSRFGYQMLMKMGWKQGAGLGKNEQGQAEHVKVSVREDNLGIGAEVKAMTWTVHRDNYDDMLSKINKVDDWAVNYDDVSDEESDEVVEIAPTTPTITAVSPSSVAAPTKKSKKGKKKRKLDTITTTETQSPTTKKQKRAQRKAELLQQGLSIEQVKIVLQQERKAKKGKKTQ